MPWGYGCTSGPGPTTPGRRRRSSTPNSDGTYQILINVSGGRFTPAYWQDIPSQEDRDFRTNIRLYVTHAESGSNAREVFLKKIDSAQVEIVQPEDSPFPMTCTSPAPHDALPEAAMISPLDYRAETGPVELVWTLHMENGDTLVLRQHFNIYPIETYNYYAEETPMNTIEDLQALVTEIERTVDPETVVNIYLPAVTYEGGLVLSNRAVNLYGNSEGEARTTFTGTTQVTSDQGCIYYFYDIDFIGDGSAGVPSTYHYTGTHFVGTDTGVLLERVPTEQTLIFDGCLFSRNGTDIDNRCAQPVNITTAVFK